MESNLRRGKEVEINFNSKAEFELTKEQNLSLKDEISREPHSLNDVIKQTQCSDRIFGYIPFENVVNLAKVSKLWQKRTESKEIWKGLDIKLPPTPNPRKFENLYRRCPEKLMFLRQKRIANKWKSVNEMPKKRIQLEKEVEFVKLVHTKDSKFIVGYPNGLIKVFDVNECLGNKYANDMKVTDKSDKLVSIDVNCDVTVWDLVEGYKLFTFEGKNTWNGEEFVAFDSPKIKLKNDLMLIIRYDGVGFEHAWVFCLKEGKLLLNFRTQSPYDEGLLKWIIDGRSIVLCSTKGKVFRWNIDGENEGVQLFDLLTHQKSLPENNNLEPNGEINIDKFFKDSKTGVFHFIGSWKSNEFNEFVVNEVEFFMNSSAHTFSNTICYGWLNKCISKLGTNSIASIFAEFDSLAKLMIVTNSTGDQQKVMRIPLGENDRICGQARMWNFPTGFYESRENHMIAVQISDLSPVYIFRYLGDTKSNLAKVEKITELPNGHNQKGFALREAYRFSPTFLTYIETSPIKNGKNIVIIDCNSD